MADKYLIYRRINTGDADFELLTETGELSYTDESALPATRYTYRVEGVIYTESGECAGKASDFLSLPASLI